MRAQLAHHRIGRLRRCNQAVLGAAINKDADFLPLGEIFWDVPTGQQNLAQFPAIKVEPGSRFPVHRQQISFAKHSHVAVSLS
jgi:hypothetical protein